jgi:hypothetical protein
MVDGWKVEILRAAMAANDDNGCGGDYQHNKTATLTRVKTVVDAAIARDIYVIIDWHSHKAHNQQSDAITFFTTEMKAYHNKPNVIFEIYNEPEAIAWNPTVKDYSQAVVNAIRSAGANNLILVGTPYADQNPEMGTNSPLTGTAAVDLAYVLHFYAASHKLNSTTWGNNSKTFQTAAQEALATQPLFVSEWGTVNYDGGGSVDKTSSDAWHVFLDQHKISSCMWQISNLGEGSSIFTSGLNIPTSGSDAAWTNQNNLSANGKYIYEKLADYAKTADWRNNPLPSSSSKGNSSSSSSGGPTPIMVSKMATTNSVQSINNGVSLQVLNNAALEIFSLNGKLFRKMDFANGIYSVQLSDLPKGLYIAKVQFGNRKEVMYVPIK